MRRWRRHLLSLLLVAAPLDSAEALARARVTPDGRPLVSPFAGNQLMFIRRREGEVFYGGRVGPGKTWALGYDALGLNFRLEPGVGKAAIEFEKYRAVLFRRTSKQLDNIISEAHKLYVNSTFNAKYVGAGAGEPGPSFRFPVYYRKGGLVHRHSYGAKIFCCHLQHEFNKFDHDGQNYLYVGFDELPHFTFTQYVYLFSRLRSSIPGLFPRMRSTGMPIGPGLPWVRRRFIVDIKPKQTYWFIRSSDGDPRGIEVAADHRDAKGELDAVSRMFIPGILEENLAINVQDVRTNVKQLGVQYERALLEEDWDAFSGDFFKMWDKSKGLIDPFPIPSSWRLTGAIDPGWSSPCAGTLTAIDPDGNVYLLFTYYERERDAIQHADGWKAMLETFPYTAGRLPVVTVAGEDAFHPRNKYEVQSNERFFADHFKDRGILLRPATTTRIPGWRALKDLMNRGKFYVFKTYNQPFLEEMVGAVADDKNPEDIMGRGNDPDVADHGLDAARYNVMATVTPKVVTQRADTWVEKVLNEKPSGGGWRPGMG